MMQRSDWRFPPAVQEDNERASKGSSGEVEMADVAVQVHQAMDGMEALDYLENCGRVPDLILLDVMMPRMGGYECCQVRRERACRAFV